jgi:hypothetical protein
MRSNAAQAVSAGDGAGGDAAETPMTGQVYRDRLDRSLLVLQVNHGSVLVEFADGSVRTVHRRDWQSLRPQFASF